MKSLIVPLLAAASFSTFLICGMVAASSLNLVYKPHKFANINNSIWTSTPVRVDRGGEVQQPEGRVAIEDNRAPAVMSDIVVDTKSSVAQNVNQSHTDWCQNRYNSYRSSDDTYQPFNSPDRRRCVSPETLASNG